MSNPDPRFEYHDYSQILNPVCELCCRPVTLVITHSVNFRGDFEDKQPIFKLQICSDCKKNPEKTTQIFVRFLQGKEK